MNANDPPRNPRPQSLAAAIHAILNQSAGHADEDADLIKEYFRIEIIGKKMVVQTGQPQWDGPYAAEMKWKKVASLPANSTPEEINQAIRDVMANERYFQVCPECEERMPVGYMMDDYCQACGEKNHGVVF